MTFSFQWVPYGEKGYRYFVRYGPITKFNRGFRTKREASEWIDSLDHIDWRVGYMFCMEGDRLPVEVVNRKGKVLVP